MSLVCVCVKEKRERQRHSERVRGEMARETVGRRSSYCAILQSLLGSSHDKYIIYNIRYTLTYNIYIYRVCSMT